MTAGPEVCLVKAYRCPHCQAALEDRTGRENPWLRCPKCGRAGRPPERDVEGEGAASEGVATPRNDLVFIDNARPGLNPAIGGGIAWPYTPSQHVSRPGSAWRVAYAAALFVSITLLLFAILDGSTYGVTAFGGMAVISLGMLIRSARG